MSALLVGYARVSTDQQDLTSQRDGLAALGVSANRIYVDHGLTGTNRERPGLREALAACREGDTLVVTKLDRLARSLPDAVGDRRRADGPTGESQSGWLSLQPQRSGRATALQCPGYGGGVRIRPYPAAHARGDEGGQGQRPPPGQAAETQPSPRSSLGCAVGNRRLHDRRSGRPLRRGPIHCLSGRRARKNTEGHDGEHSCAGDLKPDECGVAASRRTHLCGISPHLLGARLGKPQGVPLAKWPGPHVRPSPHAECQIRLPLKHGLYLRTIVLILASWRRGGAQDGLVSPASPPSLNEPCERSGTADTAPPQSQI